jgi:NADH:ubiquinone oxidoreductase subunit 3 (subunit A)
MAPLWQEIAAFAFLIALASIVVGSAVARRSSNPNRFLRFSAGAMGGFRKAGMWLSFGIMCVMLLLLLVIVVMRFVFHM